LGQIPVQREDGPAHLIRRPAEGEQSPCLGQQFGEEGGAVVGDAV
jgi:hypothetical protein